MQPIIYFILLPYAIVNKFLIKHRAQAIYLFNKNKAIFYFC